MTLECSECRGVVHLKHCRTCKCDLHVFYLSEKNGDMVGKYWETNLKPKKTEGINRKAMQFVKFGFRQTKPKRTFAGWKKTGK